MTTTTVAKYIDQHSSNSSNSSNNNNSNNNPLPPLLALGYVLVEQKCSLFGLLYKEDPTVTLLYQVAKEALDHQIQGHQSTVDVLLDVATETQKQFKRIVDEASEEEPSLKKIRSLASTGVLYTETCLHKYQSSSDESDTMPMPLDLPKSVQVPRRSMRGDILPDIPSGSQLDDMKYAREYKEDHLKTHNQMNWKACYEKGLSEGYFATYKNYKTLKNTFNDA